MVIFSGMQLPPPMKAVRFLATAECMYVTVYGKYVVPLYRNVISKKNNDERAK